MKQQIAFWMCLHLYHNFKPDPDFTTETFGQFATHSRQAVLHIPGPHAKTSPAHAGEGSIEPVISILKRSIFGSDVDCWDHVGTSATSQLCWRLKAFCTPLRSGLFYYFYLYILSQARYPNDNSRIYISN